MPVINVTKDLDALKLTITAEFAAPLERVWQVYADPRQLERVWGPPTYPATIVEHSMTAGGLMHYYMTSPEGERYYGGWRILEVDEPHRFSFDDFFADSDFNPVPGMPVARGEFAFEPVGSATRATFTSAYESAEALQQVLEMGMEEGATLATNQIDELLAA